MISAKSSIIKSTFSITLFALASGLLMGVIFALTESRIEQQKVEAQSKAINEIIPQALRDSLVLANPIELSNAMREKLNLDEDAKGYLATRDNKITAVVIPSISLSGYSGPIEMIVAIDSHLVVTGVRVISHTETPGLGDKIEKRKSDWIDSFIGYSSNDDDKRWGVKKDGGEFDQFTGATVTPRAVVTGARNAVRAVEADYDSIFGGSYE